MNVSFADCRTTFAFTARLASLLPPTSSRGARPRSTKSAIANWKLPGKNDVFAELRVASHHEDTVAIWIDANGRVTINLVERGPTTLSAHNPSHVHAEPEERSVQQASQIGEGSSGRRCKAACQGRRRRGCHRLDSPPLAGSSNPGERISNRRSVGIRCDSVDQRLEPCLDLLHPGEDLVLLGIL